MTKHIKRLSAIAAAILIVTLSILPTFAAPTGTYVENNATITEYQRLFHGSIRSTWATHDNKSVLLPVDIQDTWNNAPTEVEADPLQGTWTINHEFSTGVSGNTNFSIYGSGYGLDSVDATQPQLRNFGSIQIYDTGILIHFDRGGFPAAFTGFQADGSILMNYRTSATTNNRLEFTSDDENYQIYRTITIYSTIDEVDNGELLLSILQANAIKQTGATVIIGYPNSPSNSLSTPYTNITLDGITVPTYSCEWANEFPEEQRYIFNLSELMLPSGVYTDPNLMIMSGQFFGQKNTRAAEIRIRDMATAAIYAEWRGTLYFYNSTGIIDIVREVEEGAHFNEQFIFNDVTLSGSNTIPADYDYWSFEGDVSFTIDSAITGSETLRMYFDGVENTYYYSDGSLENSTTTNPVNAFYNAIALAGTGSGTGGSGTLTIYENGLYNVENYAYVQSSVPQEVTNAELPNMFVFLGDVVGGFLAVEIFPGFSIGGIFIFVVGVSLLFFIVKVFMGG